MPDLENSPVKCGGVGRKRKKRFMKKIVFAVLLSVLALADIYSKEFVIARNGKALVSVVENPLVKNAQEYLVQEAGACGVALKVVSSSFPGKKILFKVKRSVSVLQEDAYSITFPDDNTLVIHCSEISARFAVNHILQKAFGIRYFFAPQLRNKTLKDLYSRQINEYPVKKVVALEQKTFSDDAVTKISRNADWRIWDFASNWNGKVNVKVVHMMAIDVFPVYKYARDNSWPREILPVLNGKKLSLKKAPGNLSKIIYVAVRGYNNHWQPCWSHPATTRIAIENILQILQKDPARKVINMDVNDNGGYCQCKDCLKAVGGKRTMNGMMDYSELYWTWVNNVANAVTKKYPHVIFSCIAYREVITPPSFPLNKNILPRLCVELASMVNNDFWYKKRMELFRQWSQRAASLDVYDYIHGPMFFALPRIYFHGHVKILRDLIQNYKLRSIYFESDAVTAFQGPYQQLLMRTLWDASLDVDQFLKEWCTDAVGKKAAPCLMEYYRLWEQYWTGKEIQKTAWYQSVGSVYMQLGEVNTHLYALKKGDLQRFRACMEKVVAYAQTPGEKRRAQVLMDTFRYSELAATAAFAEILPPDGRIRNAREALALLKALPGSLKAASLLRKHSMRSIPQIKNMSERVITAGMASLGKVVPFLKEEKVRAEVLRLSRDKNIPSVLRGQFKIWLGAKAKNLIENGSLEKELLPLKPLWSSRLAGKKSHLFASEGKYSFCTGNGYYRLHPPMQPEKTYLFLCDVYIPKGSNEGRFSYKLGPSRGMVPRTWVSETDLVLSGGSWNTFSNLVSYSGEVDNLFIQLWFRKFERNEKIYFDNLRLYCLEDLLTEEK